MVYGPIKMLFDNAHMPLHITIAIIVTFYRLNHMIKIGNNLLLRDKTVFNVY